MSYFNPFSGLLESERFIFSRFYRTTIRTKIKDVFHVLSGSFFTIDTEAHIGLFDYMTWMVPYIFTGAAIWSVNNVSESKLAKLTVVPLVGIASVFAAIRYTFSLILTIGLLPLVSIAHLFFKIKANGIAHKIKSIPVKVKQNSVPYSHSSHSLSKNTVNQEVTLGQFMEDKNIQFDNLDVECAGTYKKLTFEFSQKNSLLKEEKDIAVAELEINAENKANVERVKSLSQLNVGNLPEKISRTTGFYTFFPVSGNVNYDFLPAIDTRKKFYSGY